jgi:hypothetical protein
MTKWKKTRRRSAIRKRMFDLSAIICSVQRAVKRCIGRKKT